MSNSRELQQYLQTDIQSISAEKLLVLLYEKMGDDLLEARRALVAGDRIRMADRVNHSMRIIVELRSALDHAVGGEISRNLEDIYDYMFREHLEVLVDQEVRHLDNSLAVMTPLLEAWRQVPAGTAVENGRTRTLQSVSA